MTRGGEVGRRKVETNIGWVASLSGGGRKETEGFELDGEAIKGKAGKGSKFGTDSMHDTFDFGGVEGGFEMAGEMLAVEEVKAEGVDGSRAKRAGSVVKVGRDGRKEKMTL